MFDTIVSVDKNANTKLSTTAQSIGCAIAYAVGMEDAHIHVFEEGGIFILEGDAPEYRRDRAGKPDCHGDRRT